VFDRVPKYCPVIIKLDLRIGEAETFDKEDMIGTVPP
jgi:hypothetical protein